MTPRGGLRARAALLFGAVVWSCGRTDLRVVDDGTRYDAAGAGAVGERDASAVVPRPRGAVPPPSGKDGADAPMRSGSGGSGGDQRGTGSNQGGGPVLRPAEPPPVATGGAGGRQSGAFAASCSGFEPVWSDALCAPCKVGAKAACDALWEPLLASHCAAQYSCAVNHCLCESGSCESPVCSCVATCLPRAPDECYGAWIAVMDCFARSCAEHCTTQ